MTTDTKLELLQGVLADAKVAIVTDGDEGVVGIVTKIDLIDYLAKKPTEHVAVKKKPTKKASARR